MTKQSDVFQKYVKRFSWPKTRFLTHSIVLLHCVMLEFWHTKYLMCGTNFELFLKEFEFLNRLFWRWLQFGNTPPWKLSVHRSLTNRYSNSCWAGFVTDTDTCGERNVYFVFWRQCAYFRFCYIVCKQIGSGGQSTFSRTGSVADVIITLWEGT